MWFQILDSFIILLFVLFLLFIFRGYHLSKRENEYEAKD
jgi:uncharacterized protein YneF (UPF0154 family)